MVQKEKKNTNDVSSTPIYHPKLGIFFLGSKQIKPFVTGREVCGGGSVKGEERVSVEEEREEGGSVEEEGRGVEEE